MTWSRTLLASLILIALAPPAPAGFFSRKPKPNPADRVPELLIQLKTSQDETARAAAADELRQFDPKSFPEIVSGLIDALERDASPVVRSEAATTLGRLRPISQQAGFALEQALANDAVVRVRLAARQSLWQYHLVGYRGDKVADGPASSPGSAPAATNSGTSATPRTVAIPTRFSANGRETVEPPLALPTPTPTTRPQPPAALPLTPANPGLMPVPNAPASSVNSGTVGGPALPPPG
jgi:hypothetical protein